MVALLVVAVSLDCAVLTKIRLFDLSLSLSLCIIVGIAVSYGKLSGALAGLGVGIMLDLLFAPARGFYTIANLLTGYAAGAVFGRGMRDDPFLIGLLCAGMYVLREAILIVLALLLGVNIGNIAVLIFRYLVPSALLTGLVCIPLFAVLRVFLTSGYMRKRRLGLD
jgi:rod shape-determining protein MreD